MNEEPGTTHSTEPRKVTPIPLEYGQKHYQHKDNPRLHIAWQISIGAGLWLVAAGLFLVILRIFDSTDIALGFVGPVEFILVMGIAFWLRRRFDWRGIIPGLVLGAALSCPLSCGIFTGMLQLVR
jgi:hypothetical protein